MKAIIGLLSIACIQLIAGCAGPGDKSSGPGRTMNGTYVDSASAAQNTQAQDTISRDINKDWDRVK